MPAANYNAAVLANGAAGENVMLLTARWDETTPRARVRPVLHAARLESGGSAAAFAPHQCASF